VNILLDENLDWRLGRELPGHVVESVSRNGRAGLSNGRLLAQAQERFAVFVTLDGNLVHQQHLARYWIAVVAWRARINRLATTASATSATTPATASPPDPPLRRLASVPVP